MHFLTCATLRFGTGLQPGSEGLTPNQRELLGVLGQRSGPFTMDELEAALPARSRLGIRRTAVSLRGLGLVIAPIAADAMRTGLTEAGRRAAELLAGDG